MGLGLGRVRVERASIPLAQLGSLHMFILGWQKLVYGQASSSHGRKVLQDPGFHVLALHHMVLEGREMLGCSCPRSSVLIFVCPSLWLTLSPMPATPLPTLCVPFQRQLPCRLSESSAPAERRPSGSVLQCAVAGAALFHQSGLALWSCLCPWPGRSRELCLLALFCE